MTVEEILDIPPFSSGREEKRRILMDRLLELTRYHQHNCPEYGKIMRAFGWDTDTMKELEELPYIPVRLFKELELKSVPSEEIFKTLTSSGTTSQQVSRIYLNRRGASLQQKTLVKIVTEFTGHQRMPMLIIDCPSVIKNRQMFSARGAGILGFSIFGTDKTYALNDDMSLNLPAVKEFLEKHQGEDILLFGFTFMIWQHFYKELKKQTCATGDTLDLSHGILIHGGGWKKLQKEAVSPQDFQKCLTDVCGLSKVHDYYGMVEQTGCVSMQCECGHLHVSLFSDIIIRDPVTFQPCQTGEKGLIQVLSILPESYPGHSIFTEDEGILLGEDDCACGRKGKYFRVTGRIKNAEIRGCSDTYAAKFK